MRDALCFLLTMTLLFSCIYAGSLPKALPPFRQAAWWGLLFPGFFPHSGDGDAVVFDWPVLHRVIRFFQRNG